MLFGVLAAAFIGVAFTSLALWFAGYGAMAPIASPSSRLARLREGGAPQPQRQQTGATGTALRKRVRTIDLGGLPLISGNMVERWSSDLEQAGLTLNVREYFIMRVAVGLGIGAVGALAVPAGAVFIFPLGAAIGYMVPSFWLRFQKSKRKGKIESQLSEMLSMMASALRAGFGLSQALESAAEQLPEPIAGEVRRMLRDMAVGSSIEEALDAMNERLGSSDFDITVTAIQIQRSVGGNLGEILDTVAHTIRERERIRGEIRTLTAQQRLTGVVIGLIPVGLLGVFMLINAEYAGLLFTEPLGRIMMVGGFVMWVTGFFVIQKIVNIEV